MKMNLITSGKIFDLISSGHDMEEETHSIFDFLYKVRQL